MLKLSKMDVVGPYLPQTLQPGERGEAFAPSNIALCKYWGKRDTGLNLPINASLSVSLAHLGSKTTITPATGAEDQVCLNGDLLAADSRFATKVVDFVDLFRGDLNQPLRIETHNNIPTAAGLASSASGFAALMLALDDFYQLKLEPPVLSAFARMGSGSASRSVFEGFVEWQMGHRDDGMDSHAFQLSARWPGLRIGLVKVATGEKKVDSRAGMQRTVESAHLYQSWPLQAAADLEKLHQAILAQDFALLGETAEQNALSMHATMIASWPPLLYWQPDSVAAMHKVWQLRAEGLALYFTMDAGPNLKLLFEAEDQAAIEQQFPDLEVVNPFPAG
ncbi:diphosphomevalonate decarboxylase [Marinobacterium jannaschii]|uniref:diphosphomevalonate decarboxylase n=1 Tax=Marinobacterium jannaschii TaxID=64970 RepID=UPI0004871B63|nr:diphosphomevalonate decarboxylase [Marinobacterium jannaschii]